MVAAGLTPEDLFKLAMSGDSQAYVSYTNAKFDLNILRLECYWEMATGFQSTRCQTYLNTTIDDLAYRLN